MQQRRTYSGVDKLILAAMINDQHATGGINNNNHLASTGIAPSGRGIGYYNNQRDNFTQIPTPSNRSECELYRLLERANLLNYFGTFLNFGGDDVQQLCDADEEEFIEIMSLVGMTQKPLHVRRLQKALIEWRESRDLEISMLRYTHMNYPITQSSATAPPQLSSSTRPPYDQTQNITSSGTHPLPIESQYPGELPPMLPQSKTTTAAESDQYIPPRDLLVGAPKRIRLLDSLNYRRQIDPDKSSRIESKDLTQDTSLSPKRHIEDLSDEEDTDGEDDIEVMDSSKSDGAG